MYLVQKDHLHHVFYLKLDDIFKIKNYMWALESLKGTTTENLFDIISKISKIKVLLDLYNSNSESEEMCKSLIDLTIEAENYNIL